PDIGLRAAMDLPGRRQGLAAPPSLDDEGVARIGERAGTEVRGDEKGALVHPLHVGLRLGNLEAARHELPRRHIEFAEYARILAAVGQLDQAAPALGRQTNRALEHPVLAIRLGERVYIEQDLPSRVVRLI